MDMRATYVNTVIFKMVMVATDIVVARHASGLQGQREHRANHKNALSGTTGRSRGM
jgi:hypothetical protein